MSLNEGRDSGENSAQIHMVIGVTDPNTWRNVEGRVRALREAGIRVTLISAPGEQLERIAHEEGASMIALRMQRQIAPLADLAALVQLWWLLKLLKPDIAEFSTPKAGLLGSLAARLSGVRTRVYNVRGLKFETATGFKRRLLVTAERAAAACAQSVLCNSQSLYDQALTHGLASQSKLSFLGEGSSNGVDLQRFCPGPAKMRQAMGIPDGDPVIGFAGRLTRDKGIPELVDAFDAILERIPNAHLLLVGWFDASEDELSTEYKRRIIAHPRILCTGRVPDTAPYYRAMHLLVLPSWREGFPNVVLEASATGIPVITTESTGSRDSVIPEVTGLLIPPGYSEAISDSVLKLLRDPQLRYRMGQAGREWVKAHYGREHVLGLAVEYYRGLVEKSRVETRGKAQES